jgi:hypothetical protein
MIRKSIITALVLLALYHLALPHLSHRFYQILGQQRNNYQRAQHYVFDIPDQTNVICGTSMSEKLNDDMLGPDYYKLAMPGGSVFTSLEIIQRARKRPPVVLIETNVVTRDADPELLHDLFSPVLFQLRNYSPMFREEGRPANFVGGLAEACVRKSCEWTARILGQNQSASAASREEIPDELRAKLIRAEQAGWAVKPNEESLANETAKLAQHIDALNRQGSVCILFEMPVDPALSTLPRPVMVRQALEERFPRDKYHWISFGPERNYKTRDGIHLIPEEANKLTQLIVDYVNKVSPEAGASASVGQASRTTR